MSVRTVAVDARPLNHPHTGIGRFTDNIVSRLTDFGWKPVLLKGSRARAVFQFGHASKSCDLYWSPRHHLPFGLSIPAVVTVHDLAWKRAAPTMPMLRRLFDQQMMKYSVRRATVIAAISEATARDLGEVFPGLSSKITTIPLAATITPASAPALEHSPFERYVLFVGTNEPRKNLSRVLKAFLASGIGQTHLLVIVSGRGWKETRKTPHPRIVYLDGVTDSELATLYHHCEFLIAPYLYEGFGLPVAEAAAFGKVSVTSNCSSLPEASGGGALFVNPTSVEEISAAMTRLATDRKLRDELGQIGQRSSEARSWDLVARTYAETFSELLSGLRM